MSKYGEAAQLKLRKIITEAEHTQAQLDKKRLSRPRATAIGREAARNNGNIEELQGE